MCEYGSVTTMYHPSIRAQKKINLKEQAGTTVFTKPLGQNLVHIHFGVTGMFKCVFYILNSFKNLQKSYKTKLVDTNNINTSSLRLLLDNAKNHYSENLHELN
jgi:hypothetical protein